MLTQRHSRRIMLKEIGGQEQPANPELFDEPGATSACDLKGQRRAADTTFHP